MPETQPIPDFDSLTEEDFERLAAEQKASGIDENYKGQGTQADHDAARYEDDRNRGAISPEKIVASGVATEIKYVIQKSAAEIGIDPNKVEVVEKAYDVMFYRVGSSETGYIEIGVTEDKLKLVIPPAFSKVSDVVEKAANFVFESGGVAGPRGV